MSSTERTAQDPREDRKAPPSEHHGHPFNDANDATDEEIAEFVTHVVPALHAEHVRCSKNGSLIILN